MELPGYIEQAVKDYIATTYDSDTDPSGIGGLNAVAYIGEQVVRAYKLKMRESEGK